jgi:hypothetical protein
VYGPPPRTWPPVSRRNVLRLLGVTALGLLAGCRSGKRAAPTTPGASTAAATGSRQPAATSAPPASTPTTTPTPSLQPTPPSADQLLAGRVATAEAALLAAYDAAAAAHPELADRLAPFRADHAAHLSGLVPGANPSSTTPSSPAAFGSTVPSGAASASAPLSSPPASTAILRQLADLERSAAAARVNDVVTTSGSLARLIASIGGCEAAHAALLGVAT